MSEGAELEEEPQEEQLLKKNGGGVKIVRARVEIYSLESCSVQLDGELQDA